MRGNGKNRSHCDETDRRKAKKGMQQMTNDDILSTFLNDLFNNSFQCSIQIPIKVVVVSHMTRVLNAIC